MPPANAAHRCSHSHGDARRHAASETTTMHQGQPRAADTGHRASGEAPCLPRRAAAFPNHKQCLKFSTDRPTHRLAHLPTCRLAYLPPADLPTYRPADQAACRLAHLPTCRLADLAACRLPDLPTCRLADLPTCRPADPPTCRLASLPTAATTTAGAAGALVQF